MPMDQGLDEVVSILTDYYRDDGSYLVELYGEQALTLAGEMGQMLEDILNSDTPFGQLWEEYKQSPAENEAEIIGAIEMLEEAMPEISLRLEGYYAAFQELSTPGVESLVETSEPEDTIDAEEIGNIKSTDDFDNDDEYREENEYLVGNVEDRSTSAMYIEGLDTSIEPNQSETDIDTSNDDQE